MKPQDFSAWLEHMGWAGYGGQQLAADALGATTATIRNWVAGKTKIPLSVDLACAARAQGIKPWSEYKR